MESLVGLKAIDIVQKLGESGSFQIGSYGKPICTVIPVVSDCYQLVKLFYNIGSKLDCNDYTVVRKPHNQSELAKIYRELEKELQNEGEII